MGDLRCLRRPVLLCVLCCVLCVDAFVVNVPRSLGGRSAMTDKTVETAVETTEKEGLGVDMWGEPVTANDMVPLDLDPPAVDSAAPPKVYSEADFAGSEWKIGILWRDTAKVDVTWFRCKDDKTSQWGFAIDNQGNWRVDDGLYLTVTREFLLGWHGRRLFSAKIGDDPNYLEGIIRGWKPWEPASVMGRWQAIRLNVDRKTKAPWLENENLKQQSNDNKRLLETTTNNSPAPPDVAEEEEEPRAEEVEKQQQ